MLYGINWLSDKQSNLDHLNVETLKFTGLGKKKITGRLTEVLQYSILSLIYSDTHFQRMFTYYGILGLCLNSQN